MAKDNKCKACGKDISYADCFCPNCGYEQHIYPEEMSDIIRNQVDNYESLRLENWKSHVHSPIAHLLMLGVANRVFDIYPGINTFGGSEIEGKSNHQIIIKPGVILKPLHFTIEVINDKFKFIDHIGDMRLTSSPLQNQVHILKEKLDLVFIEKM